MNVSKGNAQFDDLRTQIDTLKHIPQDTKLDKAALEKMIGKEAAGKITQNSESATVGETLAWLQGQTKTVSTPVDNVGIDDAFNVASYAKDAAKSRVTYTPAEALDNNKVFLNFENNGVVQPGGILKGKIKLHIKEPTEKRSVQFQIWGQQTASIERQVEVVRYDSNNRRYTTTETITETETLDLFNSTRLPPLPDVLQPGIYEIDISEPIPRDAVPTGGTQNVQFHAGAEFKVDKKNWFDIGEKKDLVIAPKAYTGPNSPVTIYSEKGDPSKLSVKATVDKSIINPGDTLKIDVSATGSDVNKKLENVRFELVCNETTRADGFEEIQHPRTYTLPVVVSGKDLKNSGKVSVEVPIPEDIIGTMKTPLADVQWELKVVGNVKGSRWNPLDDRKDSNGSKVIGIGRQPVY
jgi:hypothetical protein